MARKLVTSFLIAALIAASLYSAEDLYMKDTPADLGVEPNPDMGPMWISDDIWVRTSPDPSYQPYPCNESSPPWTPLPHENPEYRDPKYSTPNYVYVRIHNRGTTASTGNERLRLYWAKASTGLTWPTQWGAAVDVNGGILDYMANNCGPTKQYGAEITKPRRNAALATQAERDAYRNAVLAIGTTSSLVFPDTDYWHKQNVVHSLGPTNRHASPAFLPWHREFVNRYEVLLQEFDPTVKLLYWDWTTNPETGPFNFDTATFMGASGSGSGAANIGAPFNPSSPPTLAPPTVTRDLGGNSLVPSPTSVSDATLMGLTTFPDFRTMEKGNSTAIPGTGPHDWSHVYIGGLTGDMHSIPIAARDPFFFLLHGNVDRLWAQWQRGDASRFDPAAAYGLEQTNPNITVSMGPWDGVNFQSGPIRPWTTTDGYIVTKLPTDPSVVSPPIYDVAPLKIPVLQPGQAVVMEVPWYPPNPHDFSCFGGDQGHFCLLARIETSTSAPFGMTTAEGADIGTNVRNNNNIVWKNVTVVDLFGGALAASSIILRNPFEEAIAASLIVAAPKNETATFAGRGRLFVDLTPSLFARWQQAGARGEAVKAIGEKTGRVEILRPGAMIEGLPLKTGEAFNVGMTFMVPKDYPLRRATAPAADLLQLGTPKDPKAIVGGQRFTFDMTKVVHVKQGDVWRYWGNNESPGTAWTSIDYNDEKWQSRRAPLGATRGATTVYFRRTFSVDDPSFDRTLRLSLQRDDGAVVYLNGAEIRRVNLPEGALSPATHATQPVRGVQRTAYFDSSVKPTLLRRGENVLAAEVHRATDRDDLRFDAALSGNDVTPSAVTVAIVSPPNGALVQINDKVQVRAEAVDGRGEAVPVSISIDGKAAGTINRNANAITLTATRLGLHHIRATARTAGGALAEAVSAFNVVENTPPTAMLTAPKEGSEFKAGEGIPVAATASDRGGEVASVEFWVTEADSFASRPKRMAIAIRAPYSATLKELPPGHYMVWAVAVDNRNLGSQSIPVHIMVH